LLHQLLILIRQTFPRVHQLQQNVSLANSAPSALDAQLFHPVGGIAQAGRINDVYRYAFNHDAFTQRVAGSARNLGDDGHLITSQSIEQSAFAHVRLAGQHHIQTFAQQAALASLLQQLLQRTVQHFQALMCIQTVAGIDIFFWKIEGRLDQHAQIDQLR
jgi:hypothetical protein